jgi:hypothetical protein
MREVHERLPGRGRLLVAVGALAIACASAGFRFDPTKLNQLEPGQTTVSQAIAILGGPPYSLAQNADGSRFLVWSYAVTYPWGVQTRAVEVLFDTEGRMVRIAAGINVDVPDQ